MSIMTISLDHIFILTTMGAPEAEQLIELGLVEGNANQHPGQGTSNRRFFLPGFTIELLYVSDVDEAANGAGSRLGILERSRDSDASPFGLVVRVDNKNSEPSFPNWQYTPDYFDGKMSFYVGDNSNLVEEPLCLCMPPALPVRTHIPKEYENPDWALSRVNIAVPVDKPSAVLQHFAKMDKVRIEYGRLHKMTLEFNNKRSGSVADLSSSLPLVIEY